MLPQLRKAVMWNMLGAMFAMLITGIDFTLWIAGNTNNPIIIAGVFTLPIFAAINVLVVFNRLRVVKDAR